MTVADFQKYLRALADAVAAAKTVSRELTDAAEALGPFGHHTMADFAKFLKLAEVTYRNGELPIAPPKPPPPVKVTPAELTAAMQDVRSQLTGPNPPNRESVKSSLAKFEGLTKADLTKVVKELGYKSAPTTKLAAIDLIVDRLTAAPIAVARAGQ